MSLRYLRMRRELRRCEKATEALAKEEPPHTEEANASGQLQDLIQRSNELYEWRHLILTAYWQSKADSLGVPMPDRADKALWDRDEFENDEREPIYLTEYGIVKVKAAIREEQKHRRDAAAFWISSTVGLIGALSGLIAVFGID